MARSEMGFEGRVSLGGDYLGRAVPGAPGWVVHAVTQRRVQHTTATAVCAASGERVALSDLHVYVVARPVDGDGVGTRTYVLRDEAALAGWF